MVFQSYALFPHLDVAENILFGLKVRRVAAAERAARLKRVADLLGLVGPARAQARRSFPAGSASAWRSAAPSSPRRASA